MAESSPSHLAEVGIEHQSVSKETSEGLSSQIALHSNAIETPLHITSETPF